MIVDTFWKRHDMNRPIKRFALLFAIWDNHKIDYKCEEFDDLQSCQNVAKELEDIYNELHVLPVKVSPYVYDYSNGGSFWGYGILDMEKCEFKKISKRGLRYSTYNIERPSDLDKNPKIKDAFFRDANVCDYEFECWEEYDGWIQYRWGDGKNALNYTKPEKKKTHSNSWKTDNETVFEDNYWIDDIEDKFDKEIEKEMHKTYF